MTVKNSIIKWPVTVVVEHLTNYPKIDGLNPAAGTGREKRQKKFYVVCPWYD